MKLCDGGHVCEPDGWPASLEDRWTCPECKAEHVAFRPIDAPYLPDRFKAHLSSETLGWRRQPNTYAVRMEIGPQILDPAEVERVQRRLIETD